MVVSARFVLLSSLVFAAACASPDPADRDALDESTGDGEGDPGDGDPSGDGDGDPTGDGDGDPSGDGDPTGDGDGDPSGDGDGDPGEPLTEVAVYLSGHSLFNLEMPALLAEIAAGQGKTHRYNVQIGNGSTMLFRLSGEGSEQDRNGDVIDYPVLDEIAQANTIDASHYDVLMVTEAVDIFDQLLFSETLPSLATYYSALVDAVPDARVYFYDSWDSLETGGGTHASWVAHTRGEFEIWTCIVAKANEGRPNNPIRPIPGGMVLADLVEAADAGELPGLTASGLFNPDGHHLSALGNYAIALAQFAVLYRDSPVGSPTSFAGFAQPLEVPSDLAAAIELQIQASVQAFAATTQTPPDIDTCRASLSEYCDTQYCEGLVADLF